MTTCGESDKFVTLIASLEGGEPIRRRVRKDVIQSESSFLKEYIEDGATEIKIPLRRPKNLDSILKYLYEEQLTVSKERHLASLWNDARILGLGNLEQVCIQRLTDTISLDSWIQRLKFARAEGCHELESNVLNFVNANFEDCSSSPRFTSLNVDQMAQVLRSPTVQTTVGESKRITLILDWVKVNEDDRCPQAYRLLDQVDLMKLTRDSLQSFLHEESAFRNWRSVAIFQRAIRLKKAARHSDIVRAPLGQCQLSESNSAMPEALVSTRTIKQEVALEDSCDAEDLEANKKEENVPGNAARECTFWMKQELFCRQSPSSSSSSLSICEATETQDKTVDDDPPPSKIPRVQYSPADPFPLYQPRSSNQKQILYLRKLEYGYDLNFVILNGHSTSQAEEVQVKLPYYNSYVPKLIWSEEARGVFLLGKVNSAGKVRSTVFYMDGQRPLKANAGPSMLVARHRFQPAILNGRLYAIGGSKSVRFKNRTRRIIGDVLDMTAARSDWKWRQIRPAPMKCDLFTAAVAEGRIYMIGGLRDTADIGKKSKPVVTNEVISYEPTANKWDFVSSMSVPRCGHTSAVVGRRIYVLGGRNSKYTSLPEDHANLRTVQHHKKMKPEVYDIEENEWASIAPMLRPRYRASAVAMDDKIYVFGGDYHGGGKLRPTVECYDPVSDSWTFVSESLDGCFDSVAVIDNPEYFLR